MKNWRFNAGFLLVACAWLVPIVAHAGSMMVLGTGNAAGAGFLPNCTGQFVAVNYVPNSNDFITADGFWSAGGSNGPAGPTITTVSDTLPDGTTGNVAQAVFPAITTGTNKTSIIYHTDGNLLSNYPMTFGVWAKVTSGTGSLFQSVSNAATIFNDAAIVNDGAWHFTPVTWTGSSNGAGLINTTMEIGINQFFSTERTTVPSITVELTGAYFAPLGFASAISYSDLKVGGPLAVTSSPPLTATLTKPCPAHVALRDPTKLTAYSGNPLMSGNANEVWAGGALGAGIIQSQFQSGGFYYAFSPQCFPSPPVALVNYTAECLMRSTDGLNWSEVTTNAPYLFLTGSKMYNPVVNAVGSGFTATASGTATWTGGGCATAPVIAVSTNSSGQIATATPSPNNGL
ncbi:MAG TPA: hypothetical protein VNX46_12085, partial [Candidatus Acidoferrum sp.]|nr:hypothetical protein [Candidatus Acidoferrum sp.]